MLWLETALPRLEAAECAKWILSEVTERVSSKHQKAPFEGKYLARWTVPKHLRGSDRSERLYASFQVLIRAGYRRKEALVIVVENTKKLPKSRRGRPRLGDTKQDFFSTVESVRSEVNAFARRKLCAERAVRFWVSQFLWGRENGLIKGAAFDLNAGQRMFEERSNALRACNKTRFDLFPCALSRPG